MRDVSGTRSFASRHVLWVLTLVLVLAVSGCARKIPHMLVGEFEKVNIKTIAVLPVVDEAGNREGSAILRQRIIDTLYFKGYPRMPITGIDEKLALFFKNVKVMKAGALPPRDAGGILGADAVLYTTLKDCRTSYFLLSASTTVEATLELYNARTGQLVWRAGYVTKERSFDITKDRLRLKTSQVLEPALQAIVDKIAATLPDAPDT